MLEVFKNYFEQLWAVAKKQRREQLISYLSRKEGCSFLDCGCDAGEFTLRMKKALGAREVYGIEINKAAASKARARGIKLFLSDLNYPFPLPKESVDVVTADQVIEHLVDLDNFIQEISRVLKPSGYVVISTENLASFHNIFALLLGFQPYSGPTVSQKFVIGHHPLTPTMREMKKKKKTAVSMPGHTKVMTTKSLVELLQKHGFKITIIEGAGYLPFPPFLAKFLAKFDPYHAHFITVKARKEKQKQGGRG